MQQRAPHERSAMRMSGRWVRRGSTVILFDVDPQKRTRFDGGLAREFSFETSTGSRPLLRRGSSGAAVIDLQTQLASIGFVRPP